MMATRALASHGGGGMEAAAQDLARGLTGLGARVQLLTTGHAGQTGAVEGEIDGVPVRYLPAAPGRYSRAWWRSSAIQSLQGCDVVLGVSAAASAMARDRGRPRPGAPVFVYQAHGTALGEARSKLRRPTPRSVAGAARNLAWFAFKDRAYRDYDAVVAVGETVAKQLAAWPTRALLGPTPSTLIRNGVDANAFRFCADRRARTRRALGFSRDHRVVLVSGRLHVQKGVDVALRAFAAALATTRHLRLVIAGDGPERAGLERLARALGVGGEARFVGHIVRPQMIEHLCAADGLLFASRRVEGLPLCVLEALASGLPVLAEAGALPDLRLPAVRVRGGADAFARALQHFGAQLGDPLERASRLPAEFTLDHCAARYLDLFERLLASAAGPAP